MRPATLTQFSVNDSIIEVQRFRDLLVSIAVVIAGEVEKGVFALQHAMIAETEAAGTLWERKHEFPKYDIYEDLRPSRVPTRRSCDSIPQEYV